MQPFTILLTLVVLLLNLPLLMQGAPAEVLVFDPAAVLEGAWWRLFTHPFVHVNAYHFFLDAGAFALLWATRPGVRTAGRDLALLGACAAGSMGGALIWNYELVAAQGFCGLSGIGHGLMAYQAAVMLGHATSDPLTRRAGALLLVGLLAKGLYELITGQVFLASLHLGSVGAPVTACHLGGTLGGLVGEAFTRSGSDAQKLKLARSDGSHEINCLRNLLTNRKMRGF